MTQTASVSFVQRLRGLAGGNDLRAQLLRGGIGSALIQALNRVLALAMGIVLARNLGVEGYGIYAYAFAIMSLLMVAAEAGVPTLITREVAAAQGRGEWGLLRGAIIRGGQLVALTATIIAVVGLLVLWAIADELSRPVLYTTELMLLVLPLAALGKTVTHAICGLHRVVAGLAVNMLLWPALVLLMVSAIFFTWPDLRQPQYAMAAQVVAVLVAMLTGIWVLQRFLPAETKTHEPEYRNHKWLKSALSFTLIGGAGIISRQVDIIMLGWFRPSGEVGIYRVAVQGGVFVGFVLQAVSAVLAPNFASIYSKKDFGSLRRLYRGSAFIVFCLSIPLALVLMIFGEQLVSAIFGHEYVLAAMPLSILAVGYLFNVFFGPVGLLLQMTGNEVITSKVLWFTASLNVGMNFILIPPYGAVGGALSTAISVVLYHAILRYIVRRTLHF